MSLSQVFDALADANLMWLPEQGIGYYPVKDSPYDAAYFEKYQRMADTIVGMALNDVRTELVNKYLGDGSVIDIGIGSGAFVSGRENTTGFDINPVAVQWLIDHKKYRHWLKDADGLTFWDSLEHIHDPTHILTGARKYVFVSCPIYRDLNHLLGSKHFRKDEHCWYWTQEGLVRFMSLFGFEVQEVNWMESEIGREDIATFVFMRA